MRKSTNRFGTWGSLLAGSIALGVAWWSYSQSIDPLLEREKEARDAIASLKERVGRARTAIQDVRALESDAQTVRRQIEELGQSLPEGPATTWMPELLKQHFAAFGLNTSPSLATTSPATKSGKTIFKSATARTHSGGI